MKNRRLFSFSVVLGLACLGIGFADAKPTPRSSNHDPTLAVATGPTNIILEQAALIDRSKATVVNISADTFGLSATRFVTEVVQKTETAQFAVAVLETTSVVKDPGGTVTVTDRFITGSTKNTVPCYYDHHGTVAQINSSMTSLNARKTTAAMEVAVMPNASSMAMSITENISPAMEVAVMPTIS